MSIMKFKANNPAFLLFTFALLLQQPASRSDAATQPTPSSQEDSRASSQADSAASSQAEESQSDSGAGSQSDPNASAFANLRQLWEHNNHIKSTVLDILNEGRNSPARKKWVDYYASSLSADLKSLTDTQAKFALPQAFSSSLSSQWQSTQGIVNDLGSAVSKFNQAAQKVKAPTDQSYPPHFWGPAKEVKAAADNLDASIIAMFGALDQNLDQGASSSSAENSSAVAAAVQGAVPQTEGEASPQKLSGQASVIDAGSGFKQLSEASKQVGKACWGLFAELERWNMLYGNPPPQGIGSMLYGGGLTKEEVVSEYKYLPTFTFTSPPYLMLYSYRLPPRQNMLAYYTAKIGKLLNLIEADMNSIEIPQDRQEALAGPWENCKKLFLDCRSEYLDLYNKVNNTNDKRLKQNIREDQVAIGEPVMKIYSDMGKLQNTLADINKILK